jgi:Fur family zinc uptake transcriptional regulator
MEMLQDPNIDRSLTKNQSLVLDSLNDAKGLLSAYSILDKLRDKGFKAPLQVYRALDKLIEFGFVHRLESLNAFIACKNASCGDSAATAFVICDSCEFVQEMSDISISNFMGVLANKASVKPIKSSIELHGICNDCEKN